MIAKIRVENVKKVFNAHSRNRNEVLKGVSFELPETGLIAIYGKSGSGKTTLLNIIGGLDKQDSGKIYIDGESVKGKTDKIRNEKIGFICNIGSCLRANFPARCLRVSPEYFPSRRGS